MLLNPRDEQPAMQEEEKVSKFTKTWRQLCCDAKLLLYKIIAHFEGGERDNRSTAELYSGSSAEKTDAPRHKHSVHL